MRFSYTDTVNFIIYNKSETYKSPSASKIDLQHNCLILVPDTHNIFSYTFENDEGTIRKISGIGWNGTFDSEAYIGDSKFAYYAVDPIDGWNANNPNTPYGAYSVTIGLSLTTYHTNEVAIGSANISGWLYDSTGTTAEDDKFIFTIGNGKIDFSNGLQNLSNIIGVTQKKAIISGDTYIGWNYTQPDEAHSYRVSLTDTSGTNNLYINGSAYTTNLYITDKDHPVTAASDFDPTQPNTVDIINSYKYYTPIKRASWYKHINRLRTPCTIDWLDYYEMMFRDTIVFFKGIKDSASGTEYTVTDKNKHNGDWEKARNYWVANSFVLDDNYSGSYARFRILDCSPYWVKKPWAEGRPGKFQIFIQVQAKDDSKTYQLYIRPSKRAYDIIACVCGDAEYWFQEKELITGIHGRWSPMSQYQDTDANEDGTTKTILQKTYQPSHQIYYDISTQKYYRVDPASLDLVEIFISTDTLSSSL